MASCNGHQLLEASSAAVTARSSLSSAVKSIRDTHQCEEKKPTSANRQQDRGSSLTAVIIPQREFEHHCRAEDHQSVIMLDYTFLTNPHPSSQLKSVECRHDIARRVSSKWRRHIHYIKQQKSSWADRDHRSITFLSVIIKFIDILFVTSDAHLVLVYLIIFIALLHLHLVWPIHPRSLLDIRLHLHLLPVHLAHLCVLG